MVDVSARTAREARRRAPLLPTGAVVDLRARLHQLGTDKATGRLDVTGSPGGRVYVDHGAIGCAEQHGHQTMLLAMADAGLFSPPEWAAALKAATTDRWNVLVGEDARRLEQLVAFAADFTNAQLRVLVTGSTTSATFVAGAAHPLGTLATWSVEELLGVDVRQPQPDPADFLDLLTEISPHVRPGRDT